ncbi:MAG: thioredoxin-disulfide reductase [Calditrichaeota bacterium]|nr:MAG: thioredoxin-disulfide reductase [Calditrichota bacterium]MBL1205079.1 thioredoxin-disulfide reductase [Calditrichota bacterium]NOG44909.1 thioredoxin-disulfide reductase [Calditrichota bacterium]
MKTDYDVIVIGAGPAGLTAGMYLSRAKMNTLILNQGAVGGQTVLTHKVANYPGIESINGFQLARTMKAQAKSFGCTIKSNIKITNLRLEGPIKKVETNNKNSYSAKAVILATGGRSRSLGVAGEEDYKGQGISYCATCDGDFFQDKEIIVVGGGNSALEEAVSLTKYASKVTVVHQFDHFQAFEHAVKEAKNNPKIDFIMESTIVEFSGDDQLTGVKIKNLKTGKISYKQIDGVFILIGYVPNTELFENIISTNERNEIIVNQDLETNIEGVYSAGDANAKKYRQITTAVADGTIAALNVMEYLHD